MSNDNTKLGVIALAALVVSAMIGGGIFSLPQNMAQSASSAAVIVSWVITGIGIFFLANTFRILADARPDATTGIYAYARLGFGQFAGFQMAWSYWLSNIFGNVGYAVLLMDALDYFFPGVFTGGNNLWSIIGGSCVIWLMNFAVLRGVKQAAGVNMIGTIFKLIPLAVFILALLFVFRWTVFADSFSHEVVKGAAKLGTFPEQVKSTMLVTLWAFIGIEGAVVVSNRAKSQQAVGKATLLGFLCCLTIYVLISVLPFGKMTQPQLAGLSNPSTAPILQDAVNGHWGGVLMNLGVIIALLTSWLAFTIMIAQIPYAAAKDGSFPAVFAAENAVGSPKVSLWVSSSIMQICMIVVGLANNAWNTMLSVTGVMILPPYLFCTLYLWKICDTEEYPENLPVKKGMALLCGIAGTVYAVWMIYAAGLTYLLMAFCFLALGIPVYIRARKEDRKVRGSQEVIFTRAEGFAAFLIAVTAVVAIILFATHKVNL